MGVKVGRGMKEKSHEPEARGFFRLHSENCIGKDCKPWHQVLDRLVPVG